MRQCEITAWRRAIAVATEWTRPMHTEMARCLSTYASYATAAERQEIQALVDRAGGYRLARLLRLTGEMVA